MGERHSPTLPGSKPVIIPEIPETKIAEMNFSEAVLALLQGERITRLEWGNPRVWVWLAAFLMIRNEDNSVHTLTLSDGDMRAEDWVIV